MDKNYLVTKSNYFIMNCNYDLSLEEQKLILTLASMVQPDDEEFKAYNFKISNFIKMLGIETQTKYTEIPKITKELMKKVLEIQEGNTLLQVAWLSSARYEKGSGMVTLKFSPDLKPYMLQLKKNFTQYQLANILSMKSKYSPRIYEILKCNEFKKQGFIEIYVEELRKLINADEVYPKYNDFKRYVIERTQKELKKLTDLSFDFEEIKTGRKVTSLKIHINANKTKNKAVEEACVTSEGKCTNKEEKQFKELIRGVKIIFKGNISGLQAKSILDTAKGDTNIIKEKYVQAQNVTKMGNIVSWMITAIERDYQVPKNIIKKDKFNDYEQRSYDIDDLERKLLGWDKEERIKETGEEFQQLTIKSKKK